MVVFTLSSESESSVLAVTVEPPQRSESWALAPSSVFRDTWTLKSPAHSRCEVCGFWGLSSYYLVTRCGADAFGKNTTWALPPFLWRPSGCCSLLVMLCVIPRVRGAAQTLGSPGAVSLHDEAASAGWGFQGHMAISRPNAFYPLDLLLWVTLP